MYPDRLPVALAVAAALGAVALKAWWQRRQNSQRADVLALMREYFEGGCSVLQLAQPCFEHGGTSPRKCV